MCGRRGSLQPLPTPLPPLQTAFGCGLRGRICCRADLPTPPPPLQSDQARILVRRSRSSGGNEEAFRGPFKVASFIPVSAGALKGDGGGAPSQLQPAILGSPSRCGAPPLPAPLLTGVVRNGRRGGRKVWHFAGLLSGARQGGLPSVLPQAPSPGLGWALRIASAGGGGASRGKRALGGSEEGRQVSGAKGGSEAASRQAKPTAA